VCREVEKRDSPSIGVTPRKKSIIRQDKREKKTYFRDTNDALESNQECKVVYIFRSAHEKTYVLRASSARLESVSQVATSNRIGGR
jgi:hypothetical protein